jgi:tetratricopeptide (TPR) repeat protein/nitrate/TMAO reductase-like tetraheme cytochrome c subunit
VWQDSHHARANRLWDADIDNRAFSPDRKLSQGERRSKLRLNDGNPEIETAGASGESEVFSPDMVLAHDPLRQFLIPFPGGRWQVTDLAWDPLKDDWFNVYGDEDRQSDEWGFWTNRGMNWNAQCAFCHMTEFEKNYTISSDTYQSTWLEQGVGCVQCHGGMEGHAIAAKTPGYQRSPPQLDKAMDNCASCHSRREELTGAFKPGDVFDDHFRLSTPGTPTIYYPDGQVRDEVYVTGSFRMSKMGQAGVTCFDCHTVHAAGLILPQENNALCMRCHTAPGTNGARPIEPVAHSHHPEESTGNRCVECHMPETTYMQRDPRRDHGFTVPDPFLTVSMDIPNACNRCHTEETADWALEWTERWYGEKMDRPARRRTRAIHRAYEGDREAGDLILKVLEEESNGVWTAALLDLAAASTDSSSLLPYVRSRLQHEAPIVRAAAARALGNLPAEHFRLRPLINDPSRLVRLSAAWILLPEISRTSDVFSELTGYLENLSDQPAGAARQAQMAYHRGDFESAESWYLRAIDWDPLSALLYGDLALLYNARGKQSEALKALTQAQRINPEDPQFPFMSALLYAEQGNLPKAEAELKSALLTDPRFARAAYNLALIYAQSGRLDEAIEAIIRAQEIEPGIPDYPYTRATLLLRRKDVSGAREAAFEALAIAPDYQSAVQLLRSLPAE